MIVSLWIRAFAAAAVLPLAGGATLEQPIVRWVWSGGMTEGSALIKAGITNPGRGVRLVLSRRADFGDPVFVPEGDPARPDPSGVVAFDLTGLEPDSVYHYAVEAAGRKGLQGRFRTFRDGPMSFRAVFGSCASTGSNHRIFSTMLDFDPLFFLHMGDLHYEDIAVNDPDAYRSAFESVLASPRQSALYRSVPIAYVWDDHDYGPNNADRTAPGRPAALSVYQQYVPHYPLTRAEGAVETIHQAFSVGRVRFVLTDVRSARDPEDMPDGPDKSMLGAPQREWLLRQFEMAGEYPLVVWVNVVPWITNRGEEKRHGWAPYHWERTMIADRIQELNLVDRLLVLSGDGHMVAIDDGTHSNYASDREPGEPGFPVVQAAPLDHYPWVKGGPYSHGTAPGGVARLLVWMKKRQFGLMEVEDDGQVLQVTLTGRDGYGRRLRGMGLTLRCANRTCRVLD